MVKLPILCRIDLSRDNIWDTHAKNNREMLASVMQLCDVSEPLHGRDGVWFPLLMPYTHGFGGQLTILHAGRSVEEIAG